jgi:acyl transferase domain-containing protein
MSFVGKGLIAAQVAQKSTSWPTNGLRRISINSFGASGTNAHVILDDAYNFLEQRGLKAHHCTRKEPGLAVTISQDTAPSQVRMRDDGSPDDVPRLIVVSAFDKPTLERVIDLHSEWMKTQGSTFQENPELLQDLAYTLMKRRNVLRYRSFALLDRKSIEEEAEQRFSAPVRAMNQPRVCFVFTGQGAQWAGMGKDLLQFPVFRDTVMEANRYFEEMGTPWTVIGMLAIRVLTQHLLTVTTDVLSGTTNGHDINHPVLSQTMSTVLQVALCDLYRALHIFPTVVVGHSSGEIAAAYVHP